MPYHETVSSLEARAPLLAHSRRDTPSVRHWTLIKRLLAGTARASIASVKASREGLMLLPWPDTINLDIERPAEQNPDQHDCGEHCHTDRSLVNYDRFDDVGDNEDFQAEKDHSTEMLPEVVICATTASWDQVEDAGMNQSAQSAQYQDGHANALYDLDDVLDVWLKLTVPPFEFRMAQPAQALLAD